MCSDEDFKTALLQIHSQEKSKENSCNNKNEDNIILEELKECQNQLKNIKQICIEQHECLQRLLLQVANHKMINEVQHTKQFICPMCCLVISNSTFEEFEQHVVDHFGNYN